jgi:hypothetical protein
MQPMQRKIYMANFPAVSMRPERQELKICWSLTKCGLGLKIPPVRLSLNSNTEIVFSYRQMILSPRTLNQNGIPVIRLCKWTEYKYL